MLRAGEGVLRTGEGMLRAGKGIAKDGRLELAVWSLTMENVE